MAKPGTSQRSIRPAVLAVITVVLLVTLCLVVTADRTDVDLTEPRESAVDAELRPLIGETFPLSDVVETDASQPGSDSDGNVRERALEELARASQSFRNTTFLVAIHDAGFVCEVVAEALPVGVPTEGWQVECPQAFAYSVAVGEDGELEVLPTLNSFDGVVPFGGVPVSPPPPPR